MVYCSHVSNAKAKLLMEATYPYCINKYKKNYTRITIPKVTNNTILLWMMVALVGTFAWWSSHYNENNYFIYIIYILQLLGILFFLPVCFFCVFRPLS